MKNKLVLLMVLVFLVNMMVVTVIAANYVPPKEYGKPQNVGVTFSDDILASGRWDFNIGFGASEACRTLLEAQFDGRFESAGYDSLSVGVEGDYKLDNGQWRSSLNGYNEWVFVQDSGFNPESGTWTGAWNIYDQYFDEVFPEGILPGGGSYFDNHTMNFRLRFVVYFYHSESGDDFEYRSPWSEVVSYNNNQALADPEALLKHEPKLLSVQLDKDESNLPFLLLKATPAHDDIQLLNSISDQRVYTNVWVKVDKGPWMDAGEWLWLKEEFTVNMYDLDKSVMSEDVSLEIKFRYSFNYDYYPLSGKTGYVHSPFSNVITHGLPAYEGASSWATNELDKAAEYGLITDRIKSNMSGNITREEFAEIVVKLYERYTGNTATVGSASFIDTTNPEILKASNLNLVNGVGGNKYAPNDLVTREQMATILLRALKVLRPNEDFSYTSVSTFSDDSLIKSWAREGVYYGAKVKIINGIGNNRFDPLGNSPREQAVIVCLRALELFLAKD